MPTIAARHISRKEEEVIEDLSKAQTEKLMSVAELVLYNTGDVIIKEGDSAHYVFFVHQGRVSIEHDGICIAETGAGGYFGLMSLYDHATRSADVKAIESTALYRVKYEELRKPEFREAYDLLSKLQIKNQQSYLRTMNTRVSQSYRDKLELSERARFNSDFLIRLIGIMLIFQFVLGAFVSHKELFSGMLGWIFTPILICLLGIFCWLYLKQNNLSLEEYGWNFEGWYRYLPQTIMFTLLICSCAVLMKYLLISYSTAYIGQSLFTIDPVFNENISLGILIYLIYIVLVPIQEFTIRGVFQTGLSNVFEGRARVWKAILVSNIMFCAFHLHQSFLFAIVAFLPGLVWGYQYSKQNNLSGVVISHILVGIFCLLFLGIV